jgi:hypothetical protein
VVPRDEDLAAYRDDVEKHTEFIREMDDAADGHQLAVEAVRGQ